MQSREKAEGGKAVAWPEKNSRGTLTECQEHYRFRYHLIEPPQHLPLDRYFTVHFSTE